MPCVVLLSKRAGLGVRSQQCSLADHRTPPEASSQHFYSGTPKLPLPVGIAGSMPHQDRAERGPPDLHVALNCILHSRPSLRCHAMAEVLQGRKKELHRVGHLLWWTNCLYPPLESYRDTWDVFCIADVIRYTELLLGHSAEDLDAALRVEAIHGPFSYTKEAFVHGVRCIQTIPLERLPWLPAPVRLQDFEPTIQLLSALTAEEREIALRFSQNLPATFPWKEELADLIALLPAVLITPTSSWTTAFDRRLQAFLRRRRPRPTVHSCDACIWMLRLMATGRRVLSSHCHKFWIEPPGWLDRLEDLVWAAQAKWYMGQYHDYASTSASGARSSWQ